MERKVHWLAVFLGSASATVTIVAFPLAMILMWDFVPGDGCDSVLCFYMLIAIGVLVVWMLVIIASIGFAIFIMKLFGNYWQSRLLVLFLFPFVLAGLIIFGAQLAHGVSPSTSIIIPAIIVSCGLCWLFGWWLVVFRPLRVGRPDRDDAIDHAK